VPGDPVGRRRNLQIVDADTTVLSYICRT